MSFYHAMTITWNDDSDAFLDFGEVWLIHHSQWWCSKPHETTPPRRKTEQTAINFGGENLNVKYKNKIVWFTDDLSSICFTLLTSERNTFKILGNLQISILLTTSWQLSEYQHCPWDQLSEDVIQALQNIHRPADEWLIDTNRSTCIRRVFCTSMQNTCTLWLVQRIAVLRHTNSRKLMQSKRTRFECDWIEISMANSHTLTFFCSSTFVMRPASFFISCMRS